MREQRDILQTPAPASFGRMEGGENEEKPSEACATTLLADKTRARSRGHDTIGSGPGGARHTALVPSSRVA